MYVSECALYIIIKMIVCMSLNAFYMILLKWEINVSECALYNIFKTRAWLRPNALYMIWNWALVSVWMRFIWYYFNESFHVSEFALNFIIRMRACMCLNALCMILLKWESVCLNALYIILLKWEFVCVWMRFVYY